MSLQDEYSEFHKLNPDANVLTRQEVIEAFINESQLYVFCYKRIDDEETVFLISSNNSLRAFIKNRVTWGLTLTLKGNYTARFKDFDELNNYFDLGHQHQTIDDLLKYLDQNPQ